MSPKSTAILTVVFAVVVSLSILGVFDLPAPKNNALRPTPTTTQKQILTQRTIFPRYKPVPIKTPERTPLTLRPNSTATPEPTQTPSPFVFENFSSSSYQQIFAALDIFGTPFGGQVLSVFPCTCSGNELIAIGPPKGGIFIGPPGTLYREFNYSPGNWVLGLANGFGICIIPGPLTGCLPGIPIGEGPIIDIMGTSN